MNLPVLIIILLLNLVLNAEVPVFEKIEKEIFAADFKSDSWQKKWSWNKENKAFTVTGADTVKGRVLKLQYKKVTGRGQLGSTSFTVSAGSCIKISLSAKSQNFKGGVWVNLEQRNQKPISEQSEFFLAGGNSDWVEYIHRIKVQPKGEANGKPVKLKLWFYMYGKGEILLKNLKIELIAESSKLKEEWYRQKINSLSKSSGIKHDSPDNETTYKNLVKIHSQKLTKSGNWGILTTDSLARVFRKPPFNEQFSYSIKLDMMRHEFEGSQICLFANSGDLKNVSVSISDLTGPATIHRSNIEVLPVTYGDASKMPDLGFFKGRKSKWLPDALISNRTFNVEAGSIQPVYLRFYAPKSAKAGVYKGDVNVKTNLGAASIPVEIKVHNYLLPAHLKLKTMLLGGKGAKPEDKSYLDLALQNRIAPGNIFTGMSWRQPNFPAKGKSYDFSSVEKRLQYAIDRGLNSFAMCTTPKSGKYGFPKNYSEDWKKKMSHVVKEYSAFLEKKNWLKMAYYYNIDEPWSTRWSQVKDIYKMVKTVNPKVKVLSCVNKVGALEELKNHADVFDVYMQQYHCQQGDARKAEGKEMWWAICIWPDEKPNLFVSSQLSEARMIGWISYFYQMDGFEYWDMNSWSHDWEKGTNQKPPVDGSWLNNKNGYLLSSWPYSHTRAGDGYLTYPGDNNRALNSLRFEALRDGLEEHQLLTFLNEQGFNKEVNSVLKQMIKNVHTFNSDSQTLLNSKKFLLELLHK